eukprot:CFRG4988T1
MGDSTTVTRDATTKINNTLSQIAELQARFGTERELAMYFQHPGLTWPDLLDKFDAFSGQVRNLTHQLTGVTGTDVRFNRMVSLPNKVNDPREVNEKLKTLTDSRIQSFSAGMPPILLRSKDLYEIEEETKSWAASGTELGSVNVDAWNDVYAEISRYSEQLRLESVRSKPLAEEKTFEKGAAVDIISTLMLGTKMQPLVKRGLPPGWDSQFKQQQRQPDTKMLNARKRKMVEKRTSGPIKTGSSATTPVAHIAPTTPGTVAISSIKQENISAIDLTSPTNSVSQIGASTPTPAPTSTPTSGANVQTPTLTQPIHSPVQIIPSSTRTSVSHTQLNASPIIPLASNTPPLQQATPAPIPSHIPPPTQTQIPVQIPTSIHTSTAITSTPTPTPTSTQITQHTQAQTQAQAQAQALSKATPTHNPTPPSANNVNITQSLSALAGTASPGGFSGNAPGLAGQTPTQIQNATAQAKLQAQAQAQAQQIRAAAQNQQTTAQAQVQLMSVEQVNTYMTNLSQLEVQNNATKVQHQQQFETLQKTYNQLMAQNTAGQPNAQQQQQIAYVKSQAEAVRLSYANAQRKEVDINNKKQLLAARLINLQQQGMASNINLLNKNSMNNTMNNTMNDMSTLNAASMGQQQSTQLQQLQAMELQRQQLLQAQQDQTGADLQRQHQLKIKQLMTADPRTLPENYRRAQLDLFRQAEAKSRNIALATASQETLDALLRMAQTRQSMMMQNPQ